MNSGVYAIINTANCKRYVGSSKDLKARWAAHLSRLRRGVHHSPKLQASFNKHGESAFQFQVLLRTRTALVKNEQLAIDAADAVNNGYNIKPLAGRTQGYTHSEETCQRISRTKRGVPFSAEHKAALCAAQRKRWAFLVKQKKVVPQRVQARRTYTDDGLKHLLSRRLGRGIEGVAHV